MLGLIRKHKDKVIVDGFTQTAIYFLLMVLVIAFFALDNLNKETDFRATILFLTLFMAVYLILVALATQDRFSKRLQGKNALLFFQHDITLGTLIWIPIGVGLSFGFALLMNNIGLNQLDSALYSIYGSGFIMMAIFLKTRAYLIPVLIHGAFNTLIIISTSPAVNFSLLSHTAIPIPEIGLRIGTLNALASESIFQFFLVAPSEEMLKMGGIAFVLLLGKGKFDPKSWQFWVGAIFAVLYWGQLHLLQALT